MSSKENCRSSGLSRAFFPPKVLKMYLPFGEEYGFHNICIDGMQITLIVFETEIALGEFEQRDTSHLEPCQH